MIIGKYYTWNGKYFLILGLKVHKIVVFVL